MQEYSKDAASGTRIGHGEVRVYRGTGVSRGVRRTTWERSLKNWELQIPCFKEFFWGRNTLKLVPASLPHALGYACTFYAPTSPPPNAYDQKTVLSGMALGDIWKATKEYLNQRGTKTRVFRVLFRAPFLPPFSPHFSPLFPLQALFTLPPLPPLHLPLFPPFFDSREKLRFRYPSDLGTL